MGLDLKTFLIALYVIVDDVYQSYLRPRCPPVAVHPLS